LLNPVSLLPDPVCYGASSARQMPKAYPRYRDYTWLGEAYFGGSQSLRERI